MQEIEDLLQWMLFACVFQIISLKQKMASMYTSLLFVWDLSVFPSERRPASELMMFCQYWYAGDLGEGLSSRKATPHTLEVGVR